MGKEGKRLKRCSTSTDVEASDHKGTKLLEKAETELHNLETDVNPKKRKKKDEIKEMRKLRKSFEEMTETMKNLQEFFLGRADLPEITLKEMMLKNKPPAPSSSSKEEEEAEAQEKTEKYECCFETEDADGDNDSAVLVRGIDTCLAREDIKSALWKHFESGGCLVSRVFVPIECQTGVPLGFAFVDVDDNEKALDLVCGNIGECRFRVVVARGQMESSTFPDFRGCQYCGNFILSRHMNRRLQRRCNFY